jgi:hypothetical protein
MDAQKKAMIQAMEKSLGIVTQACKVVGIVRQTHYNWMEADPEYKTAIQQLGDVALDFAESKLHKLIDQGNPAATIFYLKTKGKNRGYIERQEIAVAEKKPLSWFTDDNADVA